MICTHHVGGRSGTQSFPIPERFRHEFKRVLYEADEACIEQIKLSDPEAIVLPYCLSALDGVRRFHHNADPHCSSMLPMNPDMKDWYFYYRRGQHDYIHGETCRTVQLSQLPVHQLDRLLRTEPGIPKPNILSLDTQGTEYEILYGARETLNSSVIAVVCEVEFHQLYDKQMLFGDICAFLSRNGFQFVKFTKPMLDYSPYRYPIGLRGDGFNVSTDALFLKKIEDVKDDRLLAKLAFTSITYGLIEYGIRCLEGVSRPEVTLDYQRFLDALEREADKMPEIYPPTFAEKFSDEASRARFRGSVTAEEDRSRESESDFLNGFEAVLYQYGFMEIADMVNRNRCRQMASRRKL